MTRALVRLVTLTALIASVLLLPSAASTPAGTAAAADLSQFDPGNIISDAIFFDGLATDAGAVQAFLVSKGAKCTAGAMPCLKNYTQTTADQAGDAYCATYRGAANESAATILVKIGQACGINPRVLLVLLQKEQGLVTGTAPTERQYTKATGFACPDTSPCNPAFSGFASQVYFAARQFQRYAAGVAGSYRAGRYNTVLYNPSASCGSSQVYITNKATAGLYSYTPYQPNAAALRAGYGTGDSCSSYGNRNFWNYFTDWFGSTQSLAATAIANLHQADGGASGWLGAETSGYLCGLTGGGCWQQFENGAIYYSPATGAHSVHGAIRAAWGDENWEAGFLGYPLIDESCGLAGGGCWQQFQGGSIYWSPATDVHYVRGAILAAWADQGWENSSIGYPTSDQLCGLTASGCWQQFQNGAIYSSPATGAHVVQGAIRALWGDQQNEAGLLGYPLMNESCGLTGGGCWQQFQGGSAYWSPATGVHFVRGAILTGWASTGWEAGPLGYPTSDEVCTAATSTCTNSFQHGDVFWSPATGPTASLSPTRDGWLALGGISGSLGRPTTSTSCGLTASGCTQTFEGGAMYWTATTGNHVVRGAILSRWGAMGSERSSLGYPTSDEVCSSSAGTCTSTFQHGAIVWSPSTGPVVVSAAMADSWAAWGGVDGLLGKPLGDTVCGLVSGGCSQTFDGGSVYTSPTAGTHFVRGAIRSVWVVRGAQNGTLGYPVLDEGCGLVGGGCFQLFQGGALYWSPASDVHLVNGRIWDVWSAQGWETGSWGYPTGDPVSRAGGVTQQFQGGTATWNTATGAVTFG